jgi:hypothetical protein
LRLSSNTVCVGASSGLVFLPFLLMLQRWSRLRRRSLRGLPSCRLGEVAVPATRFVRSMTVWRLGCSGGGYVLEGLWIWPLLPSSSGDELRSKTKTEWGASPAVCASWVVWLPFVANFVCCSVQSLGAMALVLACGGHLSSRLRRRRNPTLDGGSGGCRDLKGLVCYFQVL